MIVVRVELWSARTHDVKEIARVVIHNVGGTADRGNYECFSVKDEGADKFEANMRRLDKQQRKGKVENYPRLSYHVLNLVARALKSMDFK